MAQLGFYLSAQLRRYRRVNSWRDGQHSAQFALLIGLAAATAVGMQLIVRRSMQLGIQSVSDHILGPDTPERQAKRDREKATIAYGDGNGANLPTSTQVVTEQGRADFRRVTTVSASSKGRTVNTLERVRPLAE